MSWWEAALQGAIGGTLVEVLAVFRWCVVWQAARRTKLGRRRSNPPRLTLYVDVVGHLSIGICRAVLGAAGAVLFAVSGQISGAYAAVALGFAAPSMLAQLGQVPQIAAAVSGATSQPSGQTPEVSPAPGLYPVQRPQVPPQGQAAQEAAGEQ